MAILIIFGIVVLFAIIFTICFVNFTSKDWVLMVSVGTVTTSIIMFICMLIGTIVSFTNSEANYNALVEERKGIEFACNNMLDIYTDKLELNNSNLIKRVNNFNIILAKRKAYSHNWFNGVLISDYADDIQPISYDLILRNYNKFDKNYPVVIETPIPVEAR